MRWSSISFLHAVISDAVAILTLLENANGQRMLISC